MIDNSVRDLLYSFGYLANVAFTARFLLQWFVSERQGKSVVPKMFWQMTIAGNLLLCIHAWMQLQFHVYAISACNGVIAWRNLNLMGEHSKKISFRSTLWVLCAALMFTLFTFYISSSDGQWFRVPQSFWSEQTQNVNLFWHFLGTIGLILFSSRFWVQWWFAEKQQQSQLNALFWWLSLSGGLLSALYFLYIGDLVNAIGPGFGLVPYARNLMLLYRKPLAV